MSDRFHRAARDGYLHVLKEATKRDCNQSDEDGVTPTACAAHEGNLDALRVLVGRGGDPDKCDHYGNTPLHCAAARGHMPCVSFLVNFGANIWALDNEYHSAKELAAMNDKEEILRYLDIQSTKQEKEDPKKAKRLQEKSKKDAEKRQKEFDKIQKKADKRREEEEEKLQKEREKINNDVNTNQEPKKKGIFDTISKNSLALLAGNKNSEPKNIVNSKPVNSPKFSELTYNSNNNNKKTIGGIQKKILKKKVQEEQKATNDFKVRETEGGKKSVRSLSGLRRDSEILFVPNGSLSSTDMGKRGKLSDVFETDEVEEDALINGFSREKNGQDFKVSLLTQQRMSIFDRPGFGSVAFRNSMTSTFGTMPSSISEGSDSSRHSSEDRDLNSPHGSGSMLTPWEEEDLPSDDEEEASPVYLFLTANGLQDYMPIFTKEHVDLDALMLLTDQDLETMKLPLGPRRKLLKAVNERKLVIEQPGEVIDVRL